MNKNKIDQWIEQLKENNNEITEESVYDYLDNETDKDDVIMYLRDNGIHIIDEKFEVDVQDDSSPATDFLQRTINNPYDINEINVIQQPFTINSLRTRLEKKEIAKPDFQRKAGVWSQKQKSQLIESLILRIPLPAFYCDGTNDAKWLIIDGLQRITAIDEFYSNELVLEGMEFLSELNGLSNEKIPRNYTRHVEETHLTLYLIKSGTPENVKYNIFKRINTGGMSLESQEIRNALYQGNATKWLNELAKIELFKELTGRISTNRMLDREFVLRFVAFRKQSYKNFKNADDFLNDAMKLLNKIESSKQDMEYSLLEKDFIKTLTLNRQLFGRYAFRRMPNKDRRRPLNKSLFEAWTSILLTYTEEEQTILVSKKSKLVERYMKLFKDDSFLVGIKSIRPLIVFKKIHEIINEVLQND